VPTHRWHLIVTDHARNQIRRLSSKERQGVFQKIRELLQAGNPLSLVHVKKMATRENMWRIRYGNYRILFEVESVEITHENHLYKGTVIIVNVGHRGDIYKN
jgi:mRNA-degrading endonuclease RelE of RelBE toxin-antitoxin system